MTGMEVPIRIKDVKMEVDSTTLPTISDMTLVTEDVHGEITATFTEFTTDWINGIIDKSGCLTCKQCGCNIFREGKEVKFFNETVTQSKCAECGAPKV